MFIEIPATNGNYWRIDPNKVRGMYWSKDSAELQISWCDGGTAIIYDIDTLEEAKKIMDKIEEARSPYYRD